MDQNSSAYLRTVLPIENCWKSQRSVIKGCERASAGSRTLGNSEEKSQPYSLMNLSVNHLPTWVFAERN